MTNTNITISPGPLKGAWIKWHGSMTALSDEATCYLSSKVKCSCLGLRKSSWSHWSWTGLPWNQRVLCNSEWNVYMKTNRVNIYLYMVVKWLMPQLREDSVVSSYTIMVPLLTSTEKRDDTWTVHCHNDGWLRHGAKEDWMLYSWTTTLLDLTSCHFLLCGYVMDTVFVPPFSHTFQIWSLGSLKQ